MYEHNVVVVDENFFDFFSIPLTSGNQKTILKSGSSIAISEAIAKKYFGNESPEGKTITLNRKPFTVTGVFKNFPANTHFNFQIAISNAEWVDSWANRRAWPNFYNYIKTNAGTNWNDLQAKANSPTILEKLYKPIIGDLTTTSASHVIQPLDEISFSQKLRKDEFTPKSRTLLYIFQAIGVAVLFLAISNFVSLNASHTLQRLKEIATRKVSGAGPRHFAVQFMVESMLTFAIAITVSLTLLQISTPLVHEVLGVRFHSPDRHTVFFFGVVVCLSAVLTTLYPVYLSWIHQPQMLYQKRLRFSAGRSSWWSLSGIQYMAVTVLIIWGFMIYSQVEFILSMDLGFNRENVIVIDAPTYRNKNADFQLEGFKHTIAAIPGVQEVTQCTSEMSGSAWDVGVRRPGSQGASFFNTNGTVDENFLPFFKVPLVAGRNLAARDSAGGIIISEGAVSRLGLGSPEDAIGTVLEVDSQDGLIQVQLVGVFKEYRMRPMLRYSGDHDVDTGSGIVLFNNHKMKSWFTADKIMLRLDQGDPAATINSVSEEYKKIFPGNVFHWSFLDENINRHYINEKVWRNQIMVFTCLAIGIACLGLLGMISNKVVEKTKEIGIRRVLGAKIYQIGIVLVSTTARHVALAIVAGIPLAHYLTQEYLEKFSERITMQWWHFVIPIVLLISLMLATISSVLLKAAKSNPVGALKHE
ncbi:MAG TPA: ABC transporter permease [Cyclobacteriaceae bacterium]|nr:ABC transporter permease [Cyclobacteriaceae bacterium]